MFEAQHIALVTRHPHYMLLTHAVTCHRAVTCHMRGAGHMSHGGRGSHVTGGAGHMSQGRGAGHMSHGGHGSHVTWRARARVTCQSGIQSHFIFVLLLKKLISFLQILSN